MADNNKKKPDSYNGALTREQFLPFEMRIVAQMLTDGIDEKEVINRIVSDNLFQYPTERSTKRMVSICIARLKAMNSESLIKAVATEPMDIAKQICLYAMMKYYKIVWEFMLSVVGEKYRLCDFSFGRSDLSAFFIRLQEQDDVVASWSDSTIAKIKQVLIKILVETEYLDSNKSTQLNQIWLSPILKEEIIANRDIEALPAFNIFCRGEVL